MRAIPIGVLKCSNDTINGSGLGRRHFSQSYKPARCICDQTTEPDDFIN